MTKEGQQNTTGEWGVISQAEAARMRGVTRSAIRDLIRRGRLRAIRLGGRDLVYRSEIVNFVKQSPGRK